MSPSHQAPPRPANPANPSHVRRTLNVGDRGADVHQLQTGIRRKARDWKLPQFDVDSEGPLSQRDAGAASHLLYAMGVAGDPLDRARDGILTTYAQRLLRGTRPRTPAMLRRSKRRRDEVRNWREAQRDGGTIKIITRSEWGARPPRGSLTPQTVVNEIFIHHTVYPALSPGASIGEEMQRMRDLQRFHQDTRGYTDIAYQLVVFPSGRIYEGRPAGFQGAHTLNRNSTSKAVCFDGNFEESRPTDKAIHSARLACAHLGKGKPIRAHAAVFPTGCPGANVKAILGRLD